MTTLPELSAEDVLRQMRVMDEIRSARDQIASARRCEKRDKECRVISVLFRDCQCAINAARRVLGDHRAAGTPANTPGTESGTPGSGLESR